MRLAWRWDNAVNALIGIESSASRASSMESGLTNPRLREREWASQGIRGGKSNGPCYTDEHVEWEGYSMSNTSYPRSLNTPLSPEMDTVMAWFWILKFKNTICKNSSSGWSLRGQFFRILCLGRDLNDKKLEAEAIILWKKLPLVRIVTLDLFPFLGKLETHSW